MIYLIGGGIHCGKTSVADKASKTLGVSCLHVASLEVVILKLHTSPEQARRCFPKSWMRGPEHNNDALFGQHSPQEVTRALIAQSRSMWSAIQVFIETEVRMGRDIIVEDYHIHPEFVAHCKERFGADTVRAVFLIRKDLEKITLYNQRYPRQGDWLIERGPTNLENVARMIALFSEFVESEAARYGMRCIRPDVDEYAAKIQEATRFLIAEPGQ